MKGNAICVAGFDLKTHSWIRLTNRGYYCMFTDQKGWFPPNTVLKVRIGGHQKRSPDKDPYHLHREDRIILGRPKRIRNIGKEEKRKLLDGNVDKDLTKALVSQNRSLFLVKPKNFKYLSQQVGKPKIAFSTAKTSTDKLRSSTQLQNAHIGVSSMGCPCTCLRWKKFQKEEGIIRTNIELKSIFPNSSVYFVLSLTGLFGESTEKKHWLLVAGVHIVGDKVWL